MRSQLAIAATLVVGLRVAQAQPQPSEAERLYASGQQAYTLANYDEAIAIWERGYALSKRPAFIFNIAQAYRLRRMPGDCAKATERFRTYLGLEASNARGRASAEAFIEELKTCVDSDDARRRDPWHGPPRLDDKRPPPRGSLRRKVGLGLGFAGLGVAGAGLAFGIKARSLADEVTAACAKGCAWSDVADKDARGRSASTTQFVMYGVGGAMLGVAAVLVLTGRATDRRSSVTLAPHGDGAVVGWGGAW